MLIAEELAGRRPAPSARAGLTSAAKAASPAGRAAAVNRSRSCRSVSPATEPPSKSDSICRTTALDALGTMHADSLAE